MEAGRKSNADGPAEVEAWRKSNADVPAVGADRVEESQERVETGGSHEGRVAAGFWPGGGGRDADDMVVVRAMAPAEEEDAVE